MERQHTKTMGCSKSGPKREVYGNQCLHQKQNKARKVSNKQLNCCTSKNWKNKNKALSPKLVKGKK